MFFGLLSLTPVFFTALIAAFGGDLFAYPVAKYWRDKIVELEIKIPEAKAEEEEIKKAYKTFPAIAQQIGWVERALYVLALSFGHPEFIGAWLVFKIAVHWNEWGSGNDQSGRPSPLKAVVSRARFNSFVLNTSLSLLLSVVVFLLFFGGRGL